MTTKPATPLPWISRGNSVMHDMRDIHGATRPLTHAATYGGKTVDKDAAYIVHAANAYPRLVEALRELSPVVRSWTGVVRRSRGHHSEQSAAADAKYHKIRALLRELGELS